MRLFYVFRDKTLAIERRIIFNHTNTELVYNNLYSNITSRLADRSAAIKNTFFMLLSRIFASVLLKDRYCVQDRNPSHYE